MACAHAACGNELTTGLLKNSKKNKNKMVGNDLAFFASYFKKYYISL